MAGAREAALVEEDAADSTVEEEADTAADMADSADEAEVTVIAGEAGTAEKEAIEALSAGKALTDQEGKNFEKQPKMESF